MKRIAPAALLALAAFVVLPANSTPITSQVRSGAADGLDGDTPRQLELQQGGDGATPPVAAPRSAKLGHANERTHHHRRADAA
jgi:hypothetical protein